MRKTATRPAAVFASLSMLGMALATQPASAELESTGEAAPVAAAGVAAGNGSLVTYGTNTVFLPRAFNTVGAVFPVEYASDGDTSDVVECNPNLSATDLAKLAAARDTMEHETGAQIGIMKEKWAVKCGLATDWAWQQLKFGCDADPAGTQGMLWLGQQLQLLTNVLLFDGDNNAGKFNNFTPPAGMPDNSAYAIHPYYYSDGETGDGPLAGESWDARFGHLQEAGEALVATEWNESATCKTPEVGDDLITRYLPQHKIGLFVHSWDAPAGKLVDANYDPQDSTPSCGFTGATTAQQEFLRQAG